MLDGGVSEMLVGAAVGALFGAVCNELVNAVKEMKHKSAIFEPRMNELEAILEYAQSVLKMKTEHYNNDKNITELTKAMEKGKKLVHKCSRFERWEYIRKFRYQKKLLALNRKLVRFLILYIESQNQRYENQNDTTLLALINLQNNMMDN